MDQVATCRSHDEESNARAVDSRGMPCHGAADEPGRETVTVRYLVRAAALPEHIFEVVATFQASGPLYEAWLGEPF